MRHRILQETARRATLWERIAEFPVALDPKLLEILACPLCKGPLIYKKANAELLCKPCRLAYPIKDDIPVMLEEDARKLPDSEEV